MRWIFGFALATMLACSGDKTTDTDPGADTDTDTDADSDADVDTALAVMGYLGDFDVVVDPSDTDNGGSYSGTETYYVTSIGQGTELCKFVFQVNDNGARTWPECADPMGNPCEFGFEVEFTGGEQTVGDCDSFFGTLSTSWDGATGYGYIEDYFWEGYSYGPSLMYYFEDYYTSTTTYDYYYGWGGLDLESYGGYVSWDAGTGEFNYDWIGDTVSYFP